MERAKNRQMCKGLLVISWLAGLVALAGCTKSAMRLQNADSLDDALAEVQLVREVSMPFGGHPLEVQTVSLVGNLDGTGGDPPPSGFRQLLMSEMQKRGVENPNQILAAPSTALVFVKGNIKPGTQKGDRFDVEVFVPQEQVEVTSLRNGVMYEARLSEQMVLGGRVRNGKVLALAKGSVLVDPLADPETEPGELRRGLILGGGVAVQSRPMGLLIRPEFKNVRLSAKMGRAINKRFYWTDGGIKSGVAVPKTDGYLELAMHPRYKDNVNRYIEVIRNIAIVESVALRQLRLNHLKRQLLDPLTTATAAIQLEAIGPEALEVLQLGLASDNPEVRFAAAEALAYLDAAETVEPLGKIARRQPAFRASALAALGAMDVPAARDQLVQLLNVNSAETRYGAFRALWAMNQRDPLVRGEMLGGQFSYHIIRSNGPSMIHVTRTFRPEVVLFGADLQLQTPVILDAGKYIRVHGSDPDAVTVVKIVPGQPEQTRQVTAGVDDVVRAIMDLGGSYPDVVQVLVAAQATGSIDCRLEVDALPKQGRMFASSDAIEEALPGDADSDDLGLSATTDPEPAAVLEAGREAKQEEIHDISPAAEERWSLPRRVGRILNPFDK